MSQNFAQIAGSLAGRQIVEISNQADKIRKLELELAELRQQVEKMRNCDNCKHLGVELRADGGEPCESCPRLEKWEARK